VSLKENDIRPPELMKQKAWAVEADRQFLRDCSDRFVPVNCPACDSAESHPWAGKEGFTYRECNHCGTLFTSPRPTGEILAAFYRQSQNYAVWNSSIFPATEAARRERIFVPRARRTIDLCRQFGVEGGTMLEVGAAFGTFCDAVREHAFFGKIVAVEPTPGLAQTCRERGFITHEETVEALTFPRGGADVIAAFEVIEHLFSPQDFIRRCADFLRPGGLLICSCPSGTGLGTLVLREKARVVDHEHLNYFNPKSVGMLLERCGLETLEVTTPGELDVDLLLNQLREEPGTKVHCPLIEQMLRDPSPEAGARLQEFLKAAKLSSHLWFVGRKP